MSSSGDQNIDLQNSGNHGSNLWNAYNGVTEWLDHQRGNNDASRLDSAWFGDSAKIRSLAHSSALEFV